MAALENIWKESDRFAIVLVDIKESKETVARAINQAGLTFPVLLDSNGAVAASYRVKGIPANFLVDREGVVRDYSGGFASEEALRAKLTAFGARFGP
ncbi:MAG: TlpA family protein disulfide reductase [Chloroflexi bacterium]|nr:TlpA family protein disulfide reductase [Chloroflexota bacterium]